MTVRVTAPRVRLAPLLRLPLAIRAVPAPREERSETTALLPYRKSRALLPEAALKVSTLVRVNALALPRYTDPRWISTSPVKVLAAFSANGTSIGLEAVQLFCAMNVRPP